MKQTGILKNIGVKKSPVGGAFGSGLFPSFVADFMTRPSANIGNGITLTNARSTTATFVGSNGLVQTSAANGVRFGYSPLSPFALQGMLSEPAATQLVTPLASVRDMTNAAWVKTTMTAAFTSTGSDGAANKATRLTATAANSMALQTLIAAATSRTYSARIKRVTGTGNIEITQDGTTWTDIKAQLNTANFTVVFITATQLNAVFGIRIVTSGDEIDVDYNQFEAGAVATSSIPDDISVRNGDQISTPTGSWFNPLAGSLYIEFLNPSVSGTVIVGMFDDGTTNNFIRIYNDTITVAYADFYIAAAPVANFSAVVLTAGTVSKIISTWIASSMDAFGNNTALGVNQAAAVPAVTQLNIGSQLGAFQINSPIRKVVYYPQKLPNAAAKALTV